MMLSLWWRRATRPGVEGGMPFQDFRDFLDALRKHGELIDIDRPVAPHLEVAKALRKSAAIGGPAENSPHRARMQAMPGFADKLSDQQAAELANYLRVVWGGQQADVTTAMVRGLRLNPH